MADTLRLALVLDTYATASRNAGSRLVGFPRARKVRELWEVDSALTRIHRRLVRLYPPLLKPEGGR